MNHQPIKHQNNLKDLRIKSGFTQKYVAQVLSLDDNSKNRISRWENGLALPSVPNFIKLCKLYNCSPFDVY